MTKETLAIVGSGIAGMACAHYLQDAYDVTVFEKNDSIGGHTNTISLTEESGNVVHIDTGFMVFNKVTYPNLIRLFDDLNVDILATDMSFSVNYCPDLIEWNGAGLNKLFAQRQNLLSPRFFKFVMALDRFNKLATNAAQSKQYEGLSVAEFIKQEQFSDDFLRWYLVPMSGAIWSCNTQQIMAFPIQTLIQFFYNHGFLGLDTHHQWYTVMNGSQSYMKKLQERLKATITTNANVSGLDVQVDSVRVEWNGESKQFDKAIIAGHADDALQLLSNPTELERQLLGTFKYQFNKTLLHSDASVMPKLNRTWASWNYRVDEQSSQASTHYWMNNLQHFNKTPQSYFVSLNAEALIDPSRVHKVIDYHHPIFTVEAISAQKQLPALNHQVGREQLSFCGSYFRYGFHEDALLSALKVCDKLLPEGLSYAE